MPARRVWLPGRDSAAPDVGLLLLRLWTGGAMVALHGWAKVVDFDSMAQRFPDALGLGSPAVNLALSASAEFGAAALLMLGLGTRLAALVLAVNMTVAWIVAHGARLSGAGSGETAFIYLAAFVALLVAGPGRYSIDFHLFGATSRQ